MIAALQIFAGTFLGAWGLLSLFVLGDEKAPKASRILAAIMAAVSILAAFALIAGAVR